MSLFYHECGHPLAMEGELIADSFLVKFHDAREEGDGKPARYCTRCNKPFLDNCIKYKGKQMDSSLL